MRMANVICTRSELFWEGFFKHSDTKFTDLSNTKSGKGAHKPKSNTRIDQHQHMHKQTKDAAHNQYVTQRMTAQGQSGATPCYRPWISSLNLGRTFRVNQCGFFRHNHAWDILINGDVSEVKINRGRSDQLRNEVHGVWKVNTLLGCQKTTSLAESSS